MDLEAMASWLVTQQLQLRILTLFITILKRLWSHLLFQNNYWLSDSIITFLLLVLQPLQADLSRGILQNLWRSLIDHIPHWAGPLMETETDDLFRQYGESCELGAEMLYPPYQNCIQDSCNNAKLGHPQRTFCRIYTLRRGILPAYAVSLYCFKCNTRYHYAFSVRNPSQKTSTREYYTDSQLYIQAQETSYLETELCKYFEYYICLAHTSTANLARIYNKNLAKTDVMMNSNSALLSEISQSAVLDGFYMHSLLRRSAYHKMPLVLPHAIHNEHRFDKAMDQYNLLMAGTGQPHYFHACHDCLKFFQREDGTYYYVRGGTTDGVTLGHPCCGVDFCQIPLDITKDQYCPVHHGRAGLCRFNQCEQAASPNFLTCEDQDHRAAEQELINQREPAFNDLSRRVLKDNVPRTSLPKKRASARKRIQSTPSTDNTFLEGVEKLLEDSSDSESDVQMGKRGKGKRKGKKKSNLKLTRRWTNNEQLFVLSCGIIVARATFFNAEGVASVREFLAKIFPFPWLLPTHIFYDKACMLLSHIQTQGEALFHRVRFVVDVFHARNHHKEEHDFCNRFTNPAVAPELRTDRSGTAKWTLNSSNAEQTNVWYGAFQSITREMSVPRFNFFLDEMVRIHNEWLIIDLERKGKQPFFLSPEYLKVEWLEMYPEEKDNYT